MWRFGEIWGRHTSRRIYGCNIFSTWRLNGSCDAHNPMSRIEIGKFTVRLPRTPAAPFRSVYMWLWYVCSTIFFRKLLFSWIEFDDFFFIFHETYNNQLRERYGDDPLTHPCFDLDFWMEARLSGGPIEIGCTDSPTLRPRTCERPIVSQPLGALNRYRAPRLRNSWLCNNTWLISPKDMSNSRQIMNNSA
jgi:hypothetical protein